MVNTRSSSLGRESNRRNRNEISNGQDTVAQGPAIALPVSSSSTVSGHPLSISNTSTIGVNMPSPAAGSQVLGPRAQDIPPSGPPSGLFMVPGQVLKRGLISPYTGKDPSVHIDAWLNIYDIVTYGKTDREKAYTLVQNIDGQALTWFSKHVIPIIDTSSWAQIKQRFLERFKHQEVRPVIAASEKFLKPEEAVEKYYTDKMVLLVETNLSDLDMVALLNKGMPPMYKGHLIASKITTPLEWLSIALELESMFKNRRPFDPTSGPRPQHQAPSWRNPGPKPMVATATLPSGPKKNKTKPPGPCRICLKQNETKYHWHSECPRNTNIKKPSESGEQVPAETVGTAVILN